jgi:lantibiotic modifying enzyme
MTTDSTQHREVAEAAWRWVLSRVQWDDGPVLPDYPEPQYRHGFHSGIGGLAYVLAEVRLHREWTVAEQRLADAIVARVTDTIGTGTEYNFFDGLVSTIGVLTVLGAPGTDAAVARLVALATPTGWAQNHCVPPRFLPGARINDVTLGTAGVLLGAVWAHRNGADAGELAELAANVLLKEAETLPTGVNWWHVSPRWRTDDGRQMPNFSHGLAGIAATLALAGAEFGRSDLTDAAALGAQHLVAIGSLDGGGFTVPHCIPHDGLDDNVHTHSWCHGGAGTSLLFVALDRAGVDDVAGHAPLVWHRRCLHGVRTSGLPARVHPGFWDNDGRCCGTAGVGDVFLDSWQRTGNDDDLAFALRLADDLAARAYREGEHAYWRFFEHRADEPLLPPGTTWSQGAAGIAAFLFRVERVLEHGKDATRVPRMDSWWAAIP